MKSKHQTGKVDSKIHVGSLHQQQHNNSSEYDLGASLFTKYVKKKASLQQTNSYQQFTINDGAQP